mmetsp:Transcript_530/g.1092  ORF Transcript_530/g.1092 Transcript_530/m.1092 type:complete len:97 (-) Transcript_530:1631-1921(-)
MCQRYYQRTLQSAKSLGTAYLIGIYTAPKYVPSYTANGSGFGAILRNRGEMARVKHQKWEDHTDLRSTSVTAYHQGKEDTSQSKYDQRSFQPKNDL